MRRSRISLTRPCELATRQLPHVVFFFFAAHGGNLSIESWLRLRSRILGPPFSLLSAVHDDVFMRMKEQEKTQPPLLRIDDRQSVVTDDSQTARVRGCLEICARLAASVPTMRRKKHHSRKDL